MITDQLKKTNQKIGYYKLLMIASIGLVIIWILLTIQSAINQKYEDKQAQTASKAISADFDLEVLNLLQDKYNPTELELKKINPYTETRSVVVKPNSVYFLEEDEQANETSNPTESTESGQLSP